MSSRRRGWFAIALLLLVAVGLIEGYRTWQHGQTPTQNVPIKPPGGTPVAEPKVLTVAADGSGDFKSLTDALRRVPLGGTIRVVDAARYETPLRIDSADLFSNVTLEATAGATLATLEGAGMPVLTIHATPHLKIRGFNIETFGVQHAIEITGACPGLAIEDCQLRTKTPREARLGMMYLHGAASGEEAAPIQLRNLRIESGGVGIVVGGHEETSAVSHILITGCQIRGAARDYGVPLVLMESVSAIVATRNLLSTGTTGVSLFLRGAQRAVAVAITDNTFHNVGEFVTLDGPADQGLRFVSNLVLESEGLSRLNGSVSEIREWFEGNWWERSPGSDDSAIGQVARVIAYVPLRSREWGSSEFLTPAADAPPELPGRFGQRESSSTQGAPNSGKQE